MAIIRFTTCYDVIEAHFLKDKLENEDIECFLTNEITSSIVPVYNGMMNAGIQVMIYEEDFEKASRLIEKSDFKKNLICPNCNSSNITFGFGERKLWKIFGVILSLFVMIPFGNIKQNYFCKDCKTEF